jgi:hypothetical protein
MDLSLQLSSSGNNFLKLHNQLMMNDIFRLFSDHTEKYFGLKYHRMTQLRLPKN